MNRSDAGTDPTGDQVGSDESIVTAGAYVVTFGRLPFVIGRTAEGDRLGVVRPGGHREPGETGWHCAAREVREEAGLEICPLIPPATYWLGPPHDPAAIMVGAWPGDCKPGAIPVLVTWRVQNGARKLSVMYLAVGLGVPRPSAEASGLVLLSRSDVFNLTGKQMTLGDFARSGGQSILTTPFPDDLPLEPFLQLRVLRELLARDPAILPDLD